MPTPLIGRRDGADRPGAVAVEVLDRRLGGTKDRLSATSRFGATVDVVLVGAGIDHEDADVLAPRLHRIRASIVAFNFFLSHCS